MIFEKLVYAFKIGIDTRLINNTDKLANYHLEIS